MGFFFYCVGAKSAVQLKLLKAHMKAQITVCQKNSGLNYDTHSFTAPGERN